MAIIDPNICVLGWPGNDCPRCFPSSTIGVGTWWPATGAGTSQGWQCPGCGHCYSPATAACWHCPQQPVTATGANPLPDPEITCGACRHTAPSMDEVAWQPDWKQWRCTDPAACHKRQQEAGMEDGLHGPA